MDDLERLRFALDRVRDLPDFYVKDRIWWIYLRVAVEALLITHDLDDLRSAHARVKEFPELLPDERVRWLALRRAAIHLVDDNNPK